MWVIREVILIAVISLNGYKLRSLLTTLGISIGIFAITLVFTIVDSMQYSVSKNLASLGNTVLFVHNWPWKDNSEDWFKYFNRPKVSFSDYQRLKNFLSNVEGVSFEAIKRGATVKFKKLSVENITVRGITYDYQIIGNYNYAWGRYFTPIEVEAGRNVCILGFDLANNLFGSKDPIGQYINLRGQRLVVVGVLEKQGVSLFGESKDNELIIPYSVFIRNFDITQRKIDRVIAVKAISYEWVPKVENDITGIIRAARGLKPGVEDNFSINKQEALMKELANLFRYLHIGGIFISAFSLLIGGFGIANIMFVSVKERTKEIGIQKSLGATRNFILLQFLVESVILCIIGGILGMATFGLIAMVAKWWLSISKIGLEIVFSLKNIFIGIVISIFIGILFGLLPSYHAAQLNPVDAMRAK
ncbi:MAG: ABC transporter permease [Bacteroidia bacterium]|nr:ABC transporter permease [Bacteroidia bacterium]MDW8157580.1 ABC transporter permease [Bacteroidia bacterium]